jgi:uncharacterized protein (DUF362 family)
MHRRSEPTACVVEVFEDYDISVRRVLDRIGAAPVFARQKAILIKPNLINASPPPVTTPAACAAALVRYIRACSGAAIAIGEGCGTPTHETAAVFEALGYDKLAERYGAELVDLNRAPLRKLADPACRLFPEIHLPEIAFTHYLVSVPVLKAHSLATLTGTLKNMIGFAPPQYYSGRHGTWRKAVFHHDLQQAIRELNRYRTPDLTLMDATIGLAEYHLGGARCEPPVNRLVAGFDPVAVDREAARLLGLDWRDIPHLRDE